MPIVLADLAVAPLVAGAVAAGVAHWDSTRPADPCQPPAIRIESANIAALPGPNSPACKEAQKLKAEEQKKKAEKVEKTP